MQLTHGKPWGTNTSLSQEVFKSGQFFDFDSVPTASPKGQGDRAVFGRAYCLFVAINCPKTIRSEKEERFLNCVD